MSADTDDNIDYSLIRVPKTAISKKQKGRWGHHRGFISPKKKRK